MAEHYKTIKDQSEGLHKDKGSKFLAFAYPVVSEEEVNKRRAELRKKYFDARHHVYAFHLGVEHAIFRASDDGEPSNSSGPPVLGQIKSFGLTNILIVVVRYFGGTKLGIPGLINAYKSAAKNAIENAIIIEKNIELPLKIEFDYASMNDVMRVLKIDEIKIIYQKFDIECEMEILVPKASYDYLLNNLKKLHKIKIS